MTTNHTTHLTAIGSGKGGTGKTFLAIGLAAALADHGERVLLCDADFGLSNTTVQLGLASGGDFAGVVAGRVPLVDAAIAVSGGRGVRGGFDLLATPAGSGLFAGLTDERVIRLAAELRAARSYDRILIDLGAGIESRTLQLSAIADETLLVMTPDPSSLTDAYAFAKLLVRQGADVPRAIVNMAAGEAEAARVFAALAATTRAFIGREIQSAGFVPRDPHVAEAMKRQRSLRELFPQSPAQIAILRLAKQLHGVAAPPLAVAAVR